MQDAGELVALAPDALRSVDTVAVSAREALRPPHRDRYALVRARIAQLLGVDDPWRPSRADERLDVLPSWPTSSLFTKEDRACVAMAEQLVIDVAGVTDEQRAELARAFGDQAAALVNVLYAIEVELRLRSASRQLFGTDVVGTVAGITASAGSMPLPDALNEMTREIGGLAELDRLTSELVRLRGARIHNCRMCKALRDADAVAAGGDEELFAQIDDYESGDFSERQQVALRLTDAVLFRPCDFPAGLAEQVHEHFSAAEIVEIVLDVERNARNKVAVANGTDGQGVGEGLTSYRIDGDGQFHLLTTGASASDPRRMF